MRLRRDPRAGPTEAEFLAQVLAFARLHGWRVHHQRPGLTRGGRWVSAVQGDVGFPDAILVRAGRLIVCELKVGRNKPTAEQEQWLADFRSAGVPAYLWYPSQWPEIESVLGGGHG